MNLQEAHCSYPYFVSAGLSVSQQASVTPSWPRASGLLCPHGLRASSRCLLELYGSSCRRAAGSGDILNVPAVLARRHPQQHPGCSARQPMSGQVTEPKAGKLEGGSACLLPPHSPGIIHADAISGDIVAALRAAGG